jgi:hypothetical protein
MKSSFEKKGGKSSFDIWGENWTERGGGIKDMVITVMLWQNSSK